jgi:hypothetical protein
MLLVFSARTCVFDGFGNFSALSFSCHWCYFLTLILMPPFGSSRKFEQLSKRLRAAVSSDDLTDMTRALEEGKSEGYCDGLTDDQTYVLKTIRSDIWRTRAELSILQAQKP